MIPSQLKNENFRFCLLGTKSKIPFEESWQNINNYKYSDEKLLTHIEQDGNYGVIGGYGNLRILDIDDQDTAQELLQQLNTFTVKTSSGKGLHFYILSNYSKNHIFLESKGELRANNYQVVGPNCYAEDPKKGTKGSYEIINNSEIKYIEEKELLELLKHLIKDYQDTSMSKQKIVDKDMIESKIFPTLDILTKDLITANISKDGLKDLGYNSRSERDMKVVVSLLLKGWGEYIESIFELFPVGNKYKEHNNPKKYLEHTISSARQYSGVEEDLVISLENEINDLPEKVLRNKIDDFLKRIISIKSWILQKYIMGVIAFKTKINKKDLERRLLEIEKAFIGGEDIDVNALLNKELETIEYWLYPILPKNAVVVFGGKPEGFKSMLVLTLATSLSINQDILGIFKIHNSPKILYYDLENGQNIQHRRLKYLLKKRNYQFNNFTFSFNFNIKNPKQELEKALDYDIIILDSLRRFLEGSENESEIINNFYREFLQPLKTNNKTLIIIHHFKKGKLEDMKEDDLKDSFRGSSDILANPELTFAVMKGDELKSDDGLQTKFDVNVIKVKNRDVYPVRDFVFSVLRDDKEQSTKFEFLGYYKKIKTRDKAKNKILDLLKTNKSLDRENIVEILGRELDMSIPNIDNILKELVNDNKIIIVSHGVYKLVASENREVKVKKATNTLEEY